MITVGHSSSNRENVDKKAYSYLTRTLDGTYVGREELYGEFLPEDGSGLWSEKNIREHMENNLEDSPNSFRFCIRSLKDDVLIGSMDIWVHSWTQAEGWIGISIGERDYWGKGYGTDAMRLIVQYGFIELNLRRISLGVHAYNERAVKSYEKVGFTLEGRMRGEGFRDGVHFDGVWMGVFREEWLALQAAQGVQP